MHVSVDGERLLGSVSLTKQLVLMVAALIQRRCETEVVRVDDVQTDKAVACVPGDVHGKALAKYRSRIRRVRELPSIGARQLIDAEVRVTWC